MSTIVIPEGYRSALSLYETQAAIGRLKTVFAADLSRALNLRRVSAPLFVDPSTGLNDDLNGVERPVAFDIAATGTTAQVVHSLAKWKRMALYRYGYQPGEGIYTDMNAIRRDDDCDNLHSLFVDQWDWEKVIRREDRNVDYLKDVVKKIVAALAKTNETVRAAYPALDCKVNPDVFFITTQGLEDLYPDLSPKERENAIVKAYGTVFLMQIGDKLKSGIRHDGRAPDYDDWQLNGDILLWNDVLGCAFEISSMGIRVDAASLKAQLKKAGAEERERFAFHQGILTDTLPLSVGGGLGQSRICMLLLQKAHIGEVQVSIWPEDMRETCAAHNIVLL